MIGRHVAALACLTLSGQSTVTLAVPLMPPNVARTFADPA
jgi:hypothetical protein